MQNSDCLACSFDNNFNLDYKEVRKMAKKKKETTAIASTAIETTATETTVINETNFDFSCLPTASFVYSIVNNKTGKVDRYAISWNTNKTLTVNSNSVSDKACKLLAEKLKKREGLTDSELTIVNNSDAVKVFKYLKKRAIAQDKALRFEKSGVLFMHNGKEFRFLPKHAIDGTQEFILFKSITGDGICYLHHDKVAVNPDGFTAGVLAKGGRNAEVKETLIGFTKPFLMKFLNDTFNGKSWSEILDLCKAVEKFGTCSVPKALK